MENMGFLASPPTLWISADVNTQSAGAARHKVKRIALGAAIVGSTGEEFGALIRTETARWANVIRAAGIKVE
jgi:tripartite-type tricarboxylate transporter receptor subunit TctC